MKKIIAVAMIMVAPIALADTQVEGYYRKDGTYVQPHTRSSPNQNRYDNYGSQSRGGSQRDEYSPYGGATNRSNPSWGRYDNDGDGTPNSMDSSPGR